ncbi:glycosyltransferase family 32 protein [Dothidotthia symphoricarpi CBS 119687]|uniref:Glycosyltransferase family 32 protein n=1 Tax=Dothidotthia symphoricarpi CBS 119687 TaxID=1392245 RepID=A0A6A6ABE9_9PLEO|nr:glycosyltransferase family 32 protein [Dothidotthia symphoricarpi CBS 119687]KAF2128344.1 glycosyltransferase family 32 protein [Dothidotthia symphoricarpi CBS 119687]
MRRGITIFLLVTVVVLGFAVHSVWTLLGLLLATGREDAIVRGELPAPNSGTINDRTQLIPKIIHQTYINESIPDHWKGPQQTCIDLHPDYEYKLWTDKKSREFIATEYPWFLETFDGYPYPIQRADAIRYFVLHHFGGIYIDLDDGCNRSLDPLLAYPAWVRRTLPTGISNDAMGAVPHHPFFLKAIDSLTDYNRRWPLPYITVMASTGPLYLSLVWRHYSNTNPEGNDRLRILFPEEYNNHPWSFFTHHVGNSWHRTDVKVIFWLGRHWLLVTFLGFTAGFALLGIIYKFFFLNKQQRQPGSPKVRSSYSRVPFYRRISQKDVELDDRHQV